MAAKNGFNVTPSLPLSEAASVKVAGAAPSSTTAGVAVGETGAVPALVGLSRASLAESGFEGKVGQTLAVPRPDGEAVIAVGIGKHGRTGRGEVA